MCLCLWSRRRLPGVRSAVFASSWCKLVDPPAEVLPALGIAEGAHRTRKTPAVLEVVVDGCTLLFVSETRIALMKSLDNYKISVTSSTTTRIIDLSVTGNSPQAVMIGMARRAGIRSVATIHGLDWQRAKWGRLASRYLKHGEQVAATKADEIIVLSRSAQHYFEQTYGRKTNYIPNGVSIKESVNADLITKRYGLTCGSYILFLGRIVPEKGVHYLIEAYKALDTDKRLVIAGGSSDSNEYYEHVARSWQNSTCRVVSFFIVHCGQGRRPC